MNRETGEEIFMWILRVINSCKTEEQMKTASNLIEVFIKKLKFEKSKIHQEIGMLLKSNFHRHLETMGKGKENYLYYSK